VNAHSSARPVYVSTNSFQTRDLAAIVSLCAESRFDALELSELVGDDLTPLHGARYPSHVLVHNYFPRATPPFVLNLASRDSVVLKRSREHCRAAIDLSSELGGPVYAAHAGYTAELSPEVLGRPDRQAALPAEAFAPRDVAYATLVESARELARYAHERGMRFLIENHVLAADAGERGFDLLLMVEPSELKELTRDVDEPGFGLLVDVGHLKVSATTRGFDAADALIALSPSIGAFHLSDNDGVVDAHASFGEDAWFLPALAEVPDAAITLELNREPVGRIADVRATVARWL